MTSPSSSYARAGPSACTTPRHLDIATSSAYDGHHHTHRPDSPSKSKRFRFPLLLSSSTASSVSNPASSLVLVFLFASLLLNIFLLTGVFFAVLSPQSSSSLDAASSPSSSLSRFQSLLPLTPHTSHSHSMQLLGAQDQQPDSGADSSAAALSSANGDVKSSSEYRDLQSLLASSKQQGEQEVNKLKERYQDLLAKYQQAQEQSQAYTKQIDQLNAQLRSSAKPATATLLSAVTTSTTPTSTADCACPLFTSRLKSTDLSLPSRAFDVHEHDVSWDYCHYTEPADLLQPPSETASNGMRYTRGSPLNASDSLMWCEETATNEQYFQLTFFDRPGAGSRSFVRDSKPVSPTCTQLPPLGYQWPHKHALLPLTTEQAIHWPNLRVNELSELIVFNRHTPKNLYHFNASFYDIEQEAILDEAATYIPFGGKVRLMLDVGAGGASLGLHLKQRYDVQTVSTVFADWPYCEYISERGGLCMYIDAMEAMPFAKYTYDVVHSSWIFHALFNQQLRDSFLEQHRILRPGGYMWINGGWSIEQVTTIQQLFIGQLGYRVLHETKRFVRNPTGYKFDTVPYEVDWNVIMVRPIKATCGDADRMTATQTQQWNENVHALRQQQKQQQQVQQQ